MKVNKNLQPVSIPIEPHRHIEMTAKEALDRLWEETKSNLDTSPFSNRSDRDLILQALYKLDKLERLLTLMSYHCIVELKETSIEKSKKYIEYKEEIQELKRLFYEFKER